MSDLAAPGPSRRRALLRASLFGAAGALLYGGWALYANRGAGTATRAALTQASVSFAATFGVSVAIERLFRMGRTPQRGFWLAALGTSLTVNGLTAAAHALAGTPRILATIAPSAVIGSLFCATYAWGLRAAALRTGRGAR